MVPRAAQLCQKACLNRGLVIAASVGYWRCLAPKPMEGHQSLLVVLSGQGRAPGGQKF
jgi:hypothetical protein